MGIVDETMMAHAGELAAADRTRFDAAVAALREAVAAHQELA